MKLLFIGINSEKTKKKDLNRLYAHYSKNKIKINSEFTKSQKEGKFKDWLLLVTTNRFELCCTSKNQKSACAFFLDVIKKILKKNMQKQLLLFAEKEVMEYITLEALGLNKKRLEKTGMHNLIKESLYDAKSHCKKRKLLHEVLKNSLMVSLKWCNRLPPGNKPEIKTIKNEIEKVFPKLKKSMPKEIKEKSSKKFKADPSKILAYALENAIKFKGKAQLNAVINKLFQEGLQKDQLKNLINEIKKIIEKANSFAPENQLLEFEKVRHLLEKHKEKKQEEKVLPELPNVKGKVITRIAPEPSKYPHIGHALIFTIQYLYAKKYNGHCILRMEDTNPEKATAEFYDAIKKDLKWLGLKWDKEIRVSDDMQMFYNYAKKLIEQNDAYVCFCTNEEIKINRRECRECPCRNNSLKSNLEEWSKMLRGDYEKGECVLRLKGNMEDINSTMKDPIIFRISNARHFIYGKKYHAWPLYDFENPIQDSTNKVTHVIRTKEFELREELHSYVSYLLNLHAPSIKEIARYNIKGAQTQGRIIREMIQNKEISGWDDPRLVTIKALKRRGFLPKTFEQLAKLVGLSKTSANIDFSIIESINRKLIDNASNRYFFVADPKKIRIMNAPKRISKIPLHPDEEKRGMRELKSEGLFYISEDLDPGKCYRLMQLYNFKNKKFISEELDPKLKARLIHWIPIKQALKAKVLMPNGKWKNGLIEGCAKKIKIGEIVQLERFGFARLDKKQKDSLVFWYTHD
ncbi:MAG: glutamate--tRNA ligase [Nanoarchaeota archaeon]|nr:glutamate--tRNA ligase [Nanoarchaeota archaeon]